MQPRDPQQNKAHSNIPDMQTQESNMQGLIGARLHPACSSRYKLEAQKHSCYTKYS